MNTPNIIKEEIQNPVEIYIEVFSADDLEEGDEVLKMDSSISAYGINIKRGKYSKFIQKASYIDLEEALLESILIALSEENLINPVIFINESFLELIHDANIRNYKLNWAKFDEIIAKKDVYFSNLESGPRKSEVRSAGRYAINNIQAQELLPGGYLNNV